MQRATEIVSGAFIAIGRFIMVFTFDLCKAVYFKAQEFDQNLQQTKTLLQRLGIWTVITAIVLLILWLVSNIFFQFISTLGVIDNL